MLGDDGRYSTSCARASPREQDADRQSVCELLRTLQSSLDQPTSVGIGTPGALTADTALMKNSNSVCLNGRPLKQDIESILGYQVRLENDANCLVLSEAHYGAARDAYSVFGAILGTGCGGGVVINKTLVTGPNQIAGEWGHNPLPFPVLELVGEPPSLSLRAQ